MKTDFRPESDKISFNYKKPSTTEFGKQIKVKFHLKSTNNIECHQKLKNPIKIMCVKKSININRLLNFNFIKNQSRNKFFRKWIKIKIFKSAKLKCFEISQKSIKTDFY